MIVYQATKAAFNDDVLNDVIENKIYNFFQKNLLSRTSKQEIVSWKNSMQYMDRVLSDPGIPDDCGVSIEFQIPQSSKRIDFIVTGQGASQDDFAIIIELKQWSEATLSKKDAVINSFVGGRVRELTHPSYQAWSYATLLENFNETIATDNVQLMPCAYLHNYSQDHVITNVHYEEHVAKAPVFLKGEAVKLREFIKQHVKYGDKNKLMFRIDQGRFKPSKMLTDSMTAMLSGKQEFVMIDDQKIIYETALQLATKANINQKQVFIVKGGPGTGKSVVAINLLVELNNRGLLSKYISKNAAPRAVYEQKLTGSFKKSFITNLFGGSGAFLNTPNNTFDALIVDEAHRLNEKSGLYSNLGINQVKEIIDAAQCSIFFLDENQKVHINDIGSIDEIHKWANVAGAEILEMDLTSQFRCGGSDGYLAWLDHVLQIRETANTSMEDLNYDFRVFDDPNELRQEIVDKNQINNKSRMVAGYCWEWKSRKNDSLYDVILDEFNFQMKWNLDTDGSLWIVSPESVNEIGCIHTCQGLEVDYIGVVVGKDMVFEDGEVKTDPSKRAKSDKSIFGYKKRMSENPQETKPLIKAIIKNTYRTLMTRGMKGCYVYFEDDELREYFKSSIKA